MAKKKFTQLPVADALDGSEILAIVQDGVSKQTTANQLSSGGFSAFGEWDFATSGPSPGDFPTDQTRIYVITDDSVYPSGTWIGYSGGQWWNK